MNQRLEVIDLPIPQWGVEEVRLKMIFDNGEEYECSTKNTNDHVLLNCKIQENESNTHGNPLGIMSSNSAYFTIGDYSGLLVKSNTQSPFFGYMRNGVKCILEWVDGDNVSHPFGTYYTNGWDNTKREGAFQSANISAQDRLNYIGNLNVPELPAFSSIEISDLLINIFTAIGLESSEYDIDPSLDLTLTFSIVKGAKLRDTLNSIAQRLLAVITIDRAGIIKIRPAFPEVPQSINSIDCDVVSIGSATLKQNQYTDYATVQLSFYELGINNSVTLATVPNNNINQGENVFDNIQLSNKTQGIDLVTFEYDVDDENYVDSIDDIEYTGYQGGISVNIDSNNEETLNGIITVEGRETGDAEVVISADIISADHKVSNTLFLQNDYVQNRQQANQYLALVVDYIEKIRNSVHFENAIISYLLESGQYIRIENADDWLNGLHYVTGVSFNIGESYSVNFDTIKFDE